MKLLQRLLLIALGTSLAFLASEGVLRAAGYCPVYYYPRFLFANDATLGYRLQPGFTGQQRLGEFRVAITVNESGLRGGTEHPGRGTYRILGLGDSFTFGTGVTAEQTYLAQLQRRLQAQGVSVDAINAGVPGYGTRQELAFLKRDGPRYHPNLVMVGFLPFNDPYDNVTPYAEVRDGFLLNSQRGGLSPPAWYRVKAFLRTRCRLYSLVTNGLKESAAIRPVLVRMGLADEAFPVEMQFYLRQPLPRVEEAWRETFALFHELQQVTAQMHAQLLVVIIPSRAQVYPDRWDRAATRYHMSASTADPLLPTQKAAAYFEQQGIAYLDLLPRFVARRQSGARLYFDLDGHWSPEGHRAAAEDIAGALRSLGVVR